MSFDDEKRRKTQEVSRSSPDYFRQDKLAKLQKELEQATTKDEHSALKRERLKLEIEKAAQESRPEQDKKERVAEAHEREGDAKTFLEKQKTREQQREKAKKQAPEQEGEDVR